MPDLARIGKREREDVSVDKLNSEDNGALAFLPKIMFLNPCRQVLIFISRKRNSY